MPFQTKVNYTWPRGYAGEIASANPMRSSVAPEDGFRADVGGVVVGAFVWTDPTDDSGSLLKNSGTGTPIGFVLRDQQGLTTAYLDEYTMTIPAGFPVTAVDGGDFFAMSTTAATRGQSVYASTTDGTIQTAAKGSPPSGTVDTGWVVSRGGDTSAVIIITGPQMPPVVAAPSA